MGVSIDGDLRAIYVPVETRAREWDAKLLFALTAAAANFQVVIGPKWIISPNMHRLPRGLFGCKTLNRLDANAMAGAVSVGHSTFAWDEEGPGQIRPDVYLKSIDADAVARAGRIFAWGDHQAKMLADRFPDAKGKIEAAGNPRWDLLRPEYRGFFDAEAAALRAAHGRFILINTNFSTANSWLDGGVDSLGDIGAQTGAFDSTSDADKRMLSDINAFETRVFESYKEMLPILSRAFPDHTIILRPHPTEKHEVWSEIAAPLGNVKAIHQGGVIPWIIAADAVVQNSCTTGVESLTLGKPVVSYCKAESLLTEWHLSSHVTPRVTDVNALIDWLRRFMPDPQAFAAANVQGFQTLNRHIARLKGDTSGMAILKALHFLAVRSEKKGGVFDRVFNFDKPLPAMTIDSYVRMKLPTVTAEEFVSTVQKIAGGHPHLGRVKVMHLADSTFYLARKP